MYTTRIKAAKCLESARVGEAPTGRRWWWSRRRKFDVKIISARLLSIRLGVESELAQARATCIFLALGFVGTSFPLVFEGLPSFCRKSPLPSIAAGSAQHTQEALKPLDPVVNTCNIIHRNFEAYTNESSINDGFGELSQSVIPGQHRLPALNTPTYQQLENLVCDYVNLSRGERHQPEQAQVRALALGS